MPIGIIRQSTIWFGYTVGNLTQTLSSGGQAFNAIENTFDTLTDITEKSSDAGFALIETGKDIGISGKIGIRCGKTIQAYAKGGYRSPSFILNSASTAFSGISILSWEVGRLCYKERPSYAMSFYLISITSGAIADTLDNKFKYVDSLVKKPNYLYLYYKYFIKKF